MGYVTSYWLEVSGPEPEKVVAAADFWVKCWSGAWIDAPGTYGQKAGRWYGDFLEPRNLAGLKLVAFLFPQNDILLYHQGEESEHPSVVAITPDVPERGQT